MKAQVHCHLDAALANRLKEYCNVHRESLSAVTAQAIESFLVPTEESLAEAILQKLGEYIQRGFLESLLAKSDKGFSGMSYGVVPVTERLDAEDV